MGMEAYVALVVGMGLVTYVPRALPIIAARRVSIPPRLRVFLEYVPPAVMAALLAMSLFWDTGITLFNRGVLAALPTLIVALATRSLAASILAGVIAYTLIGMI